MRCLWSRALVAPVVVLIAAMLLAGCSGDSPEPVEPTRPAIPYTMIWSAADGIDVQKRAGELVRAAFDGGEMAAWAGVEHSFPGFADAVADAPATAVAPARAGGWAVQLGAFKTREEADKLRERLRGAQFAAFVDQTSSNGQTLWRVRAGPEAGRDGATRLRDRIKEKLKLDGLVVTQP